MAGVAVDRRRSMRNRGSPYARPAQTVGPTTAGTGGSTRILVSNLHYEVTEQDLKKLFSSVGALAQPPRIVYDRSGRSTGVAHITFERHEDAFRAKQRFDGQPAKGQNISIRFEAAIAPPAGAGGAQGKSLLARIGTNPNTSLLDRLGGPKPAAGKPIPTAPKAATGTAPTRPARGGRPARVKRPKPKSQTDLDNELDAYLGTDKSKAQTTEPAAKADDVEMAT